MYVSLLFFLLAFTSLARWSQDTTLITSAAEWAADARAEHCLMVEGRAEAGRRNLVAAAEVLDRDPTAAIAHWQSLCPFTPVCPPSVLDVTWRQEIHAEDQGVNWVMTWRERES